MDNSWMDDANCLSVDPDSMQPERATTPEVERAKRVCHGCPVQKQCRELAESQTSRLGGGSAYGVHAGEWWGPDPIWMVDRACDGCGEVFRTERSAGNRRRRFCGQACQKRALRIIA